MIKSNDDWATYSYELGFQLGKTHGKSLDMSCADHWCRLGHKIATGG